MRFIVFIALFSFLPLTAYGGWDFEKHSIPVDEILSGGPPKDGIPALFSPKYVPAADASFMKNDEKVLGFDLKGVAKAYPLRIMSWHELVNDQIGDSPILVSW